VIEKGEVGILVRAGDMGALVHLFVQFHEGVEDLIGDFFREAEGIHRLVTKQTPFGKGSFRWREVEFEVTIRTVHAHNGEGGTITFFTRRGEKRTWKTLETNGE
jgi:hypothetical protein